jgi:hypothetical protein
MIDALPHSLAAAAKTLLCINVPFGLMATIRERGYLVATSDFPNADAQRYRLLISTADILLLDVTHGGEEAVEMTRRIRSDICIAGATTRILCFSTVHRNPRFAIALEKSNARYVRVNDAGMLLEAVEQALTEISDTYRDGPSFQIIHRFSRGACGPGEEIKSCSLEFNGGLFQLSLPLTGRFLFNHLAENRPIALDACQIVAGLSGGWFYREHSGNSGIRQAAKVRIATVKVLIQRIRRSMASTFARAGLICNPYDVLRSFPAEGSTRALYKLHANVRWEHRP